MRIEDARRLHALADARYQARQQLFQSLLQREDVVRADLEKLDGQARSAEQSADGTMQSIGADVIWKTWLGKTRKSLNMQLALILAEKDQHMRQIKQAYGKVLATEEILKGLLSERNKKLRKAELDAAVEIAILDEKQQ
ncbi:hypothetical protein [uncultured Roseobacter sp.]|uniref:hypothetical protein n=1 Tax=uncultured Roseobacter sp. TaxID=114847 RepID=UPI00260EB01A|nr:hypothetical protein [uncultured Roseobacter sp.]